MNWLSIAKRVLPRKAYLRLRLVRIDAEETARRKELGKVMNLPGATTKFTTDAMEQYALPIRLLQLERQSILEELE